MARETLSMRKLQEVLRLSQEQKLSVRAIARSCCVARSTVADYLGRARASGVSWPLPAGMDEDQLEKVAGDNYISALTTITLPHERKVL